MIQGLDHLNVRVRSLADTLRFYCEVLDMRAAPPPGMPAGGSEAWIRDAQGRPVLHVGTADLGNTTGRENTGQLGGSGSIHHVAFDCTDYAMLLDRIRSAGLEVSFNDVPAARLRQMFVIDPNDILVELNFRS